MKGTKRFRRMTLRFSFLAALIFVAVLVACGGETSTDTPAPEPTAVSAISAPTEAPPTPAPATESPTVTQAPTPTQEPTATATAVPESTEEPETAEPTTTAPETEAVDPALAAASEEVYALVVELVEELGHRESGTAEEGQAAEYLKARFDALGYSAELQTFAIDYFDPAGFAGRNSEWATVHIISPVQKRLPGIPISFLPNGQMNFGPLTLITPSDMATVAEGALEGKIAFIWFDEIDLGDPIVVQGLQEQVNLAAGAGAVAAVISGPAMTFPGYQPLFEIESPIPALTVPSQDGKLVAQKLNNGVEVVGLVQI